MYGSYRNMGIFQPAMLVYQRVFPMYGIYLPHFSFLWVVFVEIKVGKHASMRHLEFRDWQTKNFKTFKLTCFSITNDLVFDPEILPKR